MELLAFYLGIAFAYTYSFYSIAVLIAVLFFKKGFNYLYYFGFGFLWAFMHQIWVSPMGMPQNTVFNKTRVEGIIQSIPNETGSKISFDFLITQLAGKPVATRVHLSCYQHCKPVHLGETWSFIVKLKHPHNLENPASFDYVGLLNAEHIHWVGFIQSPHQAIRLSSSKRHSLMHIRESIAKRLDLFPLDEAVKAVIEAQTLGLTTHMNKELWDCFRETGTTHLMVISGSHIFLIAGLFCFLLRKAWALSSQLCLLMPASQAAQLISIIIAIGYSLLTGFSIPVQRACIAYCIFSLRSFLPCPLSSWQAWRYALFFILFFEPHAVLMPGFYFSFLAVALLLAAYQYIQLPAFLKMIFIQIICLTGLMPLSLFWFSYGTINSFLANLIAIPWVGYLIVPFALLDLILIYIFPYPVLLMPLSWCIKGLLAYLEWIRNLSPLNFSLYLPTIGFVFAQMLGLALLFLIPNKRLIPLALILLCSGLKPKGLKLQEGQAQIDILDVGQGLSVVVNTLNHTLIYDTGMRFYQGGDMATLAIIPYLNYLKKKTIDKLVISHPDLDHRGGLETLENTLSVGALLVDNTDFYKRGINCHSYQAWDWDGVHFQFFPIRTFFPGKNNHSCILKIGHNKEAILLTGDIEEVAEQYLVKHYRNALSATFLLVGHHGSKTSSSSAFIRSVAPSYGIISSGLDNRYHFPHLKTIETFKQQGIKLFNTAECGMVRIVLDERLPIKNRISTKLCSIS